MVYSSGHPVLPMIPKDFVLATWETPYRLRFVVLENKGRLVDTVISTSWRNKFYHSNKEIRPSSGIIEEPKKWQLAF